MLDMRTGLLDGQYVIGDWIARVYADELEEGGTFQLWACKCDRGYPLHWAKYDAEGRRIDTGSDWSTTPTADELAAWDAIAPQVAAMRKVHKPRYIRFGRLPKGNRSVNHATGQKEKGVSCYEARLNVVTGAWELTGDGLADAAIQGAFGLYDSVWLLEGKEAGRGSDGEPVITNVKIIAKLEYDRNAGGYREV